MRRSPVFAGTAPGTRTSAAALIYAAAETGDRGRVESLVREFERSPGDVPGRVRNWLRGMTRGTALGVHRETLHQAITVYREAPRVCAYCTEYKMAEAL